MRPIKFRGRDIKTGEFVFGDLINSIPSVSLPCIVIEDVVCDVAPESVAQLCEVIDGVEYYEGDERTIDGQTYVCRIKTVWEAKS